MKEIEKLVLSPKVDTESRKAVYEDSNTNHAVEQQNCHSVTHEETFTARKPQALE